MNRQNLQTERVNYPNQSYDGALAAPSNKQLTVHSIAAYNGIEAENNLAVGHSINPGETDFGFAGDDLEMVSDEKFSMAVLDLGTAESGSPTLTYEYWDGSAWQTLELKYQPDLSTTGYKPIVFDAPLDWDLDSNDQYAIRIASSGAVTYVPDNVKFCKILAYREDVLPKAELEVVLNERQLLLQQGEEVVAFFAYPHPSNSIEIAYQINP